MMDAVGFCDLCINVKNTNEDELIQTLHKLSRCKFIFTNFAWFIYNSFNFIFYFRFYSRI